MAYIPPENILNNLLCSVCKRYLSYPPTKVYPNGEIKCGRCSSPNDAGVISIIRTLCSQFLFPCVNRFEGCHELLHSTKVASHEKTCQGIQVSCPLCPRFQGSTLHLIHHFKLEHSKSLLIGQPPELNLQLQWKFERYVLYVDFEGNKVFLLALSWYLSDLSAKCSTVSAKRDLRSTPRFAIQLLGLTSAMKECSDIMYFLISDPYNVSLKLPLGHEDNAKCKLLFTHSSALSKVEEFHCLPVEDYVKPHFRRIYHHDDQTKALNLKSFTLSSCGLKLQGSNHSLQVACDFCENFFGTSGFLKNIYHCQHCYVCGTCYSRGVTKCLLGKDELKLLKYDFYSSLRLYCKFNGCNKFCRSWELLAHEDQCQFNDKKGLCDEDYVRAVFGKQWVKGEQYLKENVVVEPDRLKNKSRLLIATRDKFKCIINYEVDYNMNRCTFHVEHQHDTSKYYVQVNKWEMGKFTREYNDFSMNTKNLNGPSLFAVTLKEVQEEPEVFYDAVLH